MAQRSVISNVAAQTDVGMVRTNNEDAFIMVDLNSGRALPSSFQVSYPVDNNLLLLVVSDGVGGEAYGEIASEMTVLAVKDALLRLPRNISTYDRLVAAIEQANHVVWREKSTNLKMRNMAATVTAVLVDGENVFIAEVGDSRAYLIRGNKIKQVTTDQTFVAMLIARGIIQPEQAVQHPRKHVILQSIGGNEAVKVAVSMFQLKRNDSLMICSDGLWEQVKDDEIFNNITGTSPEVACQRLVDLAKRRGGPDNITVILANFDGDGLKVEHSNKRLTTMIEQLSMYDPEEEVEKSHKRTKLLGSAPLTKDAAESRSKPKTRQLQPVYSLSAFPNKGIIISECQRMLEQISYFQSMLSIKPDQIAQAAEWLEKNGSQFSQLNELMTQLQYSKEQVEYLEKMMEYLLQIFNE